MVPGTDQMATKITMNFWHHVIDMQQPCKTLLLLHNHADKHGNGDEDGENTSCTAVGDGNG